MRSIIDAVRGEPRGLRPLIAFGYERWKSIIKGNVANAVKLAGYSLDAAAVDSEARHIRLRVPPFFT